MFAGLEWPSGSYGLPRPKSGCPGGEKNVWREGYRFQDMQDVKKSSEWSRVSNGSHMLGVIAINKANNRDVNRTFCMKQNTGILARFWPEGKVFLCMQNDFFNQNDFFMLYTFFE
jgi:hypothetical protein